MTCQAARSLDDLKTQFRELSEQATALVNRLDFWGRMLVWTLEPPPKFRLAG